MITQQDIEVLRVRARQITHCPDQAEELVQNALLKAWQAVQAGKFKGRTDGGFSEYEKGSAKQSSFFTYARGFLPMIHLNNVRQEAGGGQHNRGRRVLMAEYRSTFEPRQRRTPARKH